MEFRACFTFAKYENDMLSLCETSNVFLMHFCYSKIHFHQLGPFKLIKNNVEIFKYFKVYLQYGIVIQRVVTIHELPSVQLSRMMNLKIAFAKSKCLGTIWSTEMILIA